MVDKPLTYPVWAELDLVNTTSGQNNVTTPPLEYQQYGWNLGQQPPRNWFNWLGRFTNRWIKWLSQQEAQAIVTDINDGSIPVFEIVAGGMANLLVIDTATRANYYQGITFIPAAYSSGTLNLTTISSSTLTVSAISAIGSVIVSGGSGDYIIYGQMKTVP